MLPSMGMRCPEHSEGPVPGAVLGAVPGAEGNFVTRCVLMKLVDWLDDLQALQVFIFRSIILLQSK